MVTVCVPACVCSCICPCMHVCLRVLVCVWWVTTSRYPEERYPFTSTVYSKRLHELYEWLCVCVCVLVVGVSSCLLDIQTKWFEGTHTHIPDFHWAKDLWKAEKKERHYQWDWKAVYVWLWVWTEWNEVTKNPLNRFVEMLGRKENVIMVDWEEKGGLKIARSTRENERLNVRGWMRGRGGNNTRDHKTQNSKRAQGELVTLLWTPKRLAEHKIKRDFSNLFATCFFHVFFSCLLVPPSVLFLPPRTLMYFNCSLLTSPCVLPSFFACSLRYTKYFISGFSQGFYCTSWNG